LRSVRHSTWSILLPPHLILLAPSLTLLSCSELGKITLDKTFEEREALNLAIVASINAAAEAWGLQCMRYEIKDITPPEGEQQQQQQ
jgi:regulator of protease activity HflC (stomatin/prohibitin superfamily)